jgi:hypothetical protein
MMSPAEQERIADLEDQVALLEHDLGRTLALLTALGDAAGLTAPPVSQPEPEMGQLLAFPTDYRGDTHKRAAGGVSRVTPHGVPCRASTHGAAS